MTADPPHILARIVSRKREELAEKLARRGPRRDFAAALRAAPPAIIAEIKQASPSKGLLAEHFDPAAQARQYAAGGAAALSVLTDRDFFQGSLDDLRAARAAAGVPVLRKDFTISEVDIVEAAEAGADAILLIAAILTRGELERFRLLAEALEMTALVEVHDDAELDLAVESGARIIGVNNRDLRTFEVHLETGERLAARMPAGVIRVAESGILGRGDVTRLRAAGFDAFLVGEHLMRSGDPAAALRALRQ
jgi:indole-3-glycerol phosphate synthase